MTVYERGSELHNVTDRIFRKDLYKGAGEWIQLSFYPAKASALRPARVLPLSLIHISEPTRPY